MVASESFSPQQPRHQDEHQQWHNMNPQLHDLNRDVSSEANRDSATLAADMETTAAVGAFRPQHPDPHHHPQIERRDGFIDEEVEEEDEDENNNNDEEEDAAEGINLNDLQPGDGDIRFALDELLGLRGFVHLFRNSWLLLAFNCVYIGLFATMPYLIGKVFCSIFSLVVIICMSISF